MSTVNTAVGVAAPPKPKVGGLLKRIRARVLADNEIRQGIALLHAGHYAEAEAAFSRASVHGCSDLSLPSLMAACATGLEEKQEAARRLHAAAQEQPADVTAHVRHALALWSAEKRDEAVTTLRKAIRNFPENAELHFQLATLLVDFELYGEAELRFAAALNIDRNHTEALFCLAMCCGVRNAPEDALPYLKRAQSRRPQDPRIGVLLTQAAKAAQEKGNAVNLRAVLPEESADATEGVEELTRLIEENPDFVEAFLAIPESNVDHDMFTVLLRTLDAALERHAEHAELHFHCGRVLARLGRSAEAIDANERAVGINPDHVKSLIELGKLYEQTERTADAARRLEQAIAAGAEFADVFYRLGNLYRRRGHVTKARSAYKHALKLNTRYEDAERALESLPD